MKKISLILLGLVGACATLPAESRGVCNVEGLGDLVGREATTELGAEAMRRSGSARLRWIQPGDVITMDYSESRLNIYLDSRNRVDRFICG